MLKRTVLCDFPHKFTAVVYSAQTSSLLHQRENSPLQLHAALEIVRKSVSEDKYSFGRLRLWINSWVFRPYWDNAGAEAMLQRYPRCHSNFDTL